MNNLRKQRILEKLAEKSEADKANERRSQAASRFFVTGKTPKKWGYQSAIPDAVRADNTLDDATTDLSKDKRIENKGGARLSDSERGAARRTVKDWAETKNEARKEVGKKSIGALRKVDVVKAVGSEARHRKAESRGEGGYHDVSQRRSVPVSQTRSSITRQKDLRKSVSKQYSKKDS